MHDSIIAEALVEGKVDNSILRRLLFPFPIFGRKYEVVVNYDTAVQKLVEDGHYAARSSIKDLNIFPTKKTGQESIIIKLVRFRRFTSVNDALEQLDRRGLRPIEFKELLAFGSQYPLVQLEKSTVALGSRYKGLTKQDIVELGSEYKGQKFNHYRYPILSRAAEGRTLGSTFPWMAWLEDWFVAYVSK